MYKSLTFDLLTQHNHPSAALAFQVLDAFNRAESKLKPNPEELFFDVYDKMPKRLESQPKEMKQHVKNYKDEYPLGVFEKMDN